MEHDLRLARAKAHTTGHALDYGVMRKAMVHWIELLLRGPSRQAAHAEGYDADAALGYWV